MTAAQQGVQQAEAPKTLQLPSTPPNLSKIKGKSVWFISPSQAFQIIVEESQAFSNAAKAAGLNPVVFNGNSSVQLWNTGIQDAVNQHAGAIVLVAINPALVSGPLANAKAAGIPVIDTNNGSGNDPLTDGLSAHVATNVRQDGQWMADEALAQGGCTGTYGFFYTSVYNGLKEVKSAVEAEFSKLCPSCQIVVQDVPSANVATQAGPDAQTMVHSHPGLKAIMSASDAQSLFIVPALQQINSTVPVIGADPTEPNLQYVAKGQVENATVMWGPTDLLGYLLVDEMARLAAGQPAVQEDYPSQLVTTKTIGSVSSVWSSLGNVPQQFQALWAKG